jgi:hypothetical protein
MARTVLLLPGISYSTSRPLLHRTGAVFRRHGWRVSGLEWSGPPPARDGQGFPEWFARLHAFVEHQVRSQCGSAPPDAVAGKSMGSFAAGFAADHELPGVWLTPVLRDSPVPADLRRAAAPFFLAGSATDPSWDRSVAHGFGQPVFEADGADHSLEFPADPERSAGLLRDLTVALDAFVRDL